MKKVAPDRKNVAVKKLKTELINAAGRANPKERPPTDAPVHQSWKKLLEASSGGTADEKTVRTLAQMLRDTEIDVHNSDNTSQLETILEIGHAIARVLKTDPMLAKFLDFNYKDAAEPEVVAWEFVLHRLQKMADTAITAFFLISSV